MKGYTIKQDVAGELRINAEVVEFDLKAGPVPAGTRPEVVDYVAGLGLLEKVPTKREEA